MKRKLTVEERLVTLEAINHLVERLKILDFYKRYYNLMLNDGLKLQFLEKEHQFKQQQHEYLKEEQESNLIIENLKKQCKEGIEIKNGSTTKK